MSITSDRINPLREEIDADRADYLSNNYLKSNELGEFESIAVKQYRQTFQLSN